VVCLQVPYPARRYAVDARQRALWLARDAMLVATAPVTAGFVAVSDDLKRVAVRTFHLAPSKVETIHHGVDARFGPPDAAAARAEVDRRFRLEGPYLLAASDVYVHKNYGNLVRGFARALPRLGDRVLAVAGGAVDPSETKRVEAVLARTRAASRVRFLGRVEAGAMPALYGAADAFVFPSRHEAFGLPPLEAMACGTPVAASDASCVPEVCGDAARYFDPGDPDAIGDALVAVATKERLREDLRAKGLARAARFTWDRSARAHREAFARATR
jgi:glycosyltransferase involved in cell wall biosynthesis